MQEMYVFGITASPWLVAPLAYLLWVMLFWILKSVGFATVKRVVGRTRTRIDDILISAADLPLSLLIFASGGLLVERMLPFISAAGLTNYVFLGFKAVTIVALILFVDQFIIGLLREYSGRVEILKMTGDVLHGFVRMLVFGLGLLILLDSFGVSITPIIASLGIGTLAIALALQPTLENLFAGVQIAVDKPMLVGHFIRLESGEEGLVHKIGWRSTWIRLPPDNIVVIPNKTLVNSIILNYHYPDRETNLVIGLGVHYQSDLEHVERVTIEVARDVLKTVPGGVADFEPSVRFHTFADYSINLNVVLRVKEQPDTGMVRHEFIKRLKKRYEQEGVVIPYPVQAVNHQQEQAFETLRGENR